MNYEPAAIVWDLDGTLIDSAADLAQALNAVLVEHGHVAIDKHRIRMMIGDGVGKLIERGFSAAGERLTEPQLQDVMPRFMSIYTDCATENTRLYPGARTVLQQFAEAGVRQGLCTNKPESISRQILAGFKLADIFDAVVGGDTTGARKPDPLPLQSCIGSLNVAPQQSIMIGDSGVDVATARAVGVRVGLVSHGYSRTDVSTLGADFVVHHLPSIAEFLVRPISTIQELSCLKR